MSISLFMLDCEDVFLHLQQRGVEVEPVASNVNGHRELKYQGLKGHGEKG